MPCMRAMLFRSYGGPEVLEAADVADFEPGPCQALVDVKTVALNHLDLWTRRGIFGDKLPLPHVGGSDVAGVVRALGPGAENAASVGDEVVVCPSISCGRCQACLSGNDVLCRGYMLLGEHTWGGLAAQVLVPMQNLVPRPRRLSWAEAAAFPVTYLTAWHMLRARAPVAPGKWVLVHAALSGVGVASVQIAKLLGATVIATAGGPDKCARAGELGADHLIDSKAQDFLAEVKRLTDRRGVDIVIEHVGQSTWEKSVLSLTHGGTLVTCGATTGYDCKIDLRFLFRRQLSLLGSTMGSKAEMIEVARLMEAGQLRPLVDRVMPVTDVAAAHRLLEERKVAGKLVLEWW